MSFAVQIMASIKYKGTNKENGKFIAEEPEVWTLKIFWGIFLLEDNNFFRKWLEFKSLIYQKAIIMGGSWNTF